jgi:hypothetical protein
MLTNGSISGESWDLIVLNPNRTRASAVIQTS